MCSKPREYSTETRILNIVQDWYPSFDMRRNKVFVQGLRPDLLIRVNGGVVILEVDEHCHEDRVTYPDEAGRMYRMWESTRTPMVFVRFNPDAFHDDNGNAVRIAEDIRLDELRKLLDSFLDPNFKFPEKPLLKFMYYPRILENEVSEQFISLIH